MQLVENPTYGLQLRRFIEYILFDLYSQGIAAIGDTFWREYGDYLEMQMQFYGKVKEKYPANFKTEHDIMTLKINQMKAACRGDRSKDTAYSSLQAIVRRRLPGLQPSHLPGQRAAL